jgi:hypothetical protein
LQINGSSTGITYGIQLGRYLQIGSLVWIGAKITLTSKGASVGAVTISNLPVTQTANSSFANNIICQFAVVTLGGSFTSLRLSPQDSGTAATFTAWGTTEATTTGLVDTMIADTSQFDFSGFYFV